MNQPLHVFGVSTEQARMIPPTDFGPLASLAVAVRNVPGVFNAEAVPAKDQNGTELILLRVHKHFISSWDELTPRITRAISRCCSPFRDTVLTTLDEEDEATVLAA